MFGAPGEGNFSIDESKIDDILQVSVEENKLLTTPYYEEAVKKAFS